MKKRKLIINILACLISFVTLIGINFFLTPYITENIGTDAYGFVSLANNFVNYASIITLALNSMSSRFISVAIFKNDNEEANKYFTSALVANIFMILLLLVPSILCIIYLNNLISIPDHLIPSVKILFSLIFFNFYLSLLNSTYSVSTYAANKIELFTIRNMEASIIKVASMFILFYIFDANIIIIGFSTILATAYLFVFNIHYKIKFLPFIKIKKKYFELKKVIEMIMSGIWNTITKIGQVLSDGLDLLITNIFINPIAMGQLSIVKTISSSVSVLTSSLVNVFQPNITKKYADNDKTIVEDINFSMKVVSLFANILLVGLMCYGIYFYRLWLPSENHELLSVLTIITIVGSVIGTAVTPLFSVFTITNKLKLNSISVLLTGFINIVVVYLFLKFNLFKEPIIVVAGISTIIGTIRNLIFVPIYSAKCLNAKTTSFYSPIIRSIISSILMTLAFLGISKLIIINSWLKLIVMAGLSAIVGFVISLVVLFSPKEYLKISDLIKSKILKIKF